MTREEAIENIKLIRFNAALTNANSFKEALDMAIEVLSLHSLPSDLDEAAVEYVKDYGYTEDDYKRERIIAEEHFKAGAEWMAGRGITVDGTFHHSCGYPSVIELKTYLRDYEGADVIVTIRKK